MRIKCRAPSRILGFRLQLAEPGAPPLRPFLSELGCLPVSKQVVIPDAPSHITENGDATGKHKEGIEKTTDTMLEQLKWWATACRAQREQDVAKE